MSEFIEYFEMVRRRPAMFVGGTSMFGFINYFVCPVALLLANGATCIDITVNEEFEISSDAMLTIQQTDEGRIAPFQEVRSTDIRNSEALVLNALSQELHVTVNTASGTEELRFSQGILLSHIRTKTAAIVHGTILHFVPDNTVFTVTTVAKAFFASYFLRLCHFHKGVRFSLTAGNEKREYFTENGMVDLFTSIATPYQLMHEPIHIVGYDGKLDLEVVMAYQSWTDNHLQCFINNRRAVDGGTHKQGFVQALKRLKRKLDMPDRFNNGVVAVASFRYPGAIWESARIGNPELKPMVSRLVISETVEWLNNHPSVEAQIRQLETFQFHEIW